MRLALRVLVVVPLLSLGIFAQGISGAEPYSATGDLFVTDSGTSSVWRLQDLNLDGDYNDASEVFLFYSGPLGTVPLSNNTGVAVGPDGTVYVSDSTTDVIGGLRDLDGNGDALGVNEHWIFFNGTAGGNASGVVMTSAQELTVDGNGVVWVASANVGAGGQDAILRLEDLGGLPGANDAGEALVYCNLSPGLASGVSIPTSVLIGPGGFVYYLENGTSGTPARGIYRLHDDVVPNGNCNDPGEVTPYFIPPALGATAFLWGMTLDSTGVFYVVDQGNDVVWRVFDVDNSRAISPGAPETTLYWTSPAPSLNWSVTVASDKSLFTCESQSPDRILRMSDTVVLNGNVNDPGEVVAVYDNTVASSIIANPRAAAFQRLPTLETNLTPSIGTVTTIDYLATAGHPLQVWFSLGATTLPVLPLGVLRLDIFTPGAFGPLYADFVPVSGKHTVSVLIPNDPGIVGSTLHLQGFSGLPARVQLSTWQGVTFQL